MLLNYLCLNILSFPWKVASLFRLSYSLLLIPETGIKGPHIQFVVRTQPASQLYDAGHILNYYIRYETGQRDSYIDRAKWTMKVFVCSQIVLFYLIYLNDLVIVQYLSLKIQELLHIPLHWLHTTCNAIFKISVKAHSLNHHYNNCHLSNHHISLELLSLVHSLSPSEYMVYKIRPLLIFTTLLPVSWTTSNTLK